MDIINKKYILPALALFFLLVVFLDQNNTPVPLKIILGSPFNLSLSTLMVISALVGAGSTIAGIYITQKIRNKWKRNGQ